MNKTRMANELYKVKREIVIHGSSYEVYKDVLDEYNEKTDEQVKVGTIKGLFHISKGYIAEAIQDGTRTHSKGQPMLLMTCEESQSVLVGHYLLINQNKYKVIEKNNIQEYGIIVDVSLELVLKDG